MNKKILIIFIIFLLTGCYDHKELNTLAILTATEINKIDNEYIVTAQVVNPQSPDKTITVQAPFIIYEGKGKTIQEAYRSITLQSSRYLYPNHLQIMIINENIAKEDVTEILDFYLRNPAIRTEFNILVGKGNDILNITTPIDPVSSTSILESLKTSNKYYGVSNLITLNELASMNINPNLEIVLPSIQTIKEENKENKEDKENKKDNTNKDKTEESESKEDKSDTTENTESTKVKSMYKLGGLAIFKDQKLIGYLTDEESITYNMLTNNIQNTLLSYECDKNKYITLEIIKNKSKISTKNKEINIELSIEGTINESTCNIELNNTKNIEKLQKNISKYLKEKVENDINNIRNKYNSDIFGFLDIIYKYDYKTYQEVKSTWYDKTFKNIKINIKTKTKITANGNVMEGNNEKN